MATVNKRVWTSGGKRKEGWRVSYTDANGERHHVQKRTKKEAEAYRIKVESEVVAGIHTPDAESITVAEAADLWLAAAEAKGCDRGTIKTYREIVSVHVKPLVGSEKLSKLSAPKIAAFRDALLQTRSHAMAAKGVRGLSMILGTAVERGLVAQNVARGIKVGRPRGDGKAKLAKRADIPPRAHLRAMLDAADRLSNEDPRLPVMLRVVMLAGLRASELRAFPWNNADLHARQLTVTQRADRWNEIGAPKSNAGHRTIPIGPGLAMALKAWKLRCPPSDLNLMFPARPRGRQWGSSAGATSGTPIKQGTMAALLLTIQVAAGIALDTGRKDERGGVIWGLRWDWHHLRHVAASNWLADGIDLKRLQVWIAHENIQLTIDVYGHLMADAGRDAELASKAEAALLA